MNPGWVSLGNIRSPLTTEKSPRYSFLSEFPQTTQKRGATRCPHQTRKEEQRFPRWPRPRVREKWFTAQSQWVFPRPCGARQGRNSRPPPPPAIAGPPISSGSLFTVHLWASPKARPRRHCVKPWAASPRVIFLSLKIYIAFQSISSRRCIF